MLVNKKITIHFVLDRDIPRDILETNNNEKIHAHVVSLLRKVGIPVNGETIMDIVGKWYIEQNDNGFIINWEGDECIEE